jgi:hypothetical protein
MLPVLGMHLQPHPKQEEELNDNDLPGRLANVYAKRRYH